MAITWHRPSDRMGPIMANNCPGGLGRAGSCARAAGARSLFSIGRSGILGGIAYGAATVRLPKNARATLIGWQPADAGAIVEPDAPETS